MKMQMQFLFQKYIFICALLYQWHAIKGTLERGIGIAW